MKAITWILVLGIVVGGIVLISRNQTENEVGENVDMSAKVMGYEEGFYTIVPTASTVAWKGSFLNGSRTHTGTIAVVDGAVEILGTDITGGSLMLAMDSIAEDDGNTQVVDHLKTDDFFDVETYGTATFVVKSSVPREDISVGSLVTGDLTIRDITEEVVIPVIVSGTAEGDITLSGEIGIDRSIWEVKYGSSSFFSNLGDKVIDDIITVSFMLTAEKQQEEVVEE